MMKRWSWMAAGVLWIASGCNNNEAEMVATQEEQQAIRQLHTPAGKLRPREETINYLVWEGVTVNDVAGNPVRVVRVKFTVGASTTAQDFLYRFDNGHPVQNRLNGSGDRWQQEAAVWVKGRT
jgi:hypothetical protein